MELTHISKKRVFLTVSVLCLIGLILVVFSLALLSRDTIYSNIFVDKVDVGGLNTQDAEKLLIETYGSKLNSVEVKLTYGESSWIISPNDIDYTFLFSDAINEAHKIGRSNNFVGCIKEIFALRKNPIVIPLKASYNNMKLDEIVERISIEVNHEPVNASIRRKNNGFEIIEEVSGTIVNRLVTKENILVGLENLESAEVEIAVINITPSITKEYLSAIDNVVSEFNTTFNPQIVGRVRNIEVAASRVNGTLLMPMEIFSFNDTTGARSRAEGYHEAPIIVNGKFVPGVGGGVCQVSTTLYNAVVRSDLTIVERRNHSLPVGYVPLGQDATVTDSFIDFRFQNNKSYPVYIESYVENDRLYVRIYGQKKDDFVIELHSQIAEVISPTVDIKKDPNMTIGERKVIQEAKNGYRVDTYKVYFREGLQVKREHISRDYYKPVNGEIIEGVKQVSTVPNDEIEEVNINNTEAID